MTLNPKQEQFCQEYIIDLNGTQAAIRSGIGMVTPTKRQYYTYLLIDPRDNRIFYVGKGKGKRISSHAARSMRGHVDNGRKHKVIQEIQSSGFQVIERYFSAHDDEAISFAIERVLIEKFKGLGLTNISGGIVSSAEAAQAGANFWLERMKPFEQWVAEATDDTLALVSRVFGGPEIIYRKVYGGFKALAGAK